jgi:hypothetical protein
MYILFVLLYNMMSLQFSATSRLQVEEVVEELEVCYAVITILLAFCVALWYENAVTVLFC